MKRRTADTSSSSSTPSASEQSSKRRRKRAAYDAAVHKALSEITSVHKAIVSQQKQASDIARSASAGKYVDLGIIRKHEDETEEDLAKRVNVFGRYALCSKVDWFTTPAPGVEWAFDNVILCDNAIYMAISSSEHVHSVNDLIAELVALVVLSEVRNGSSALKMIDKFMWCLRRPKLYRTLLDTVGPAARTAISRSLARAQPTLQETTATDAASTSDTTGIISDADLAVVIDCIDIYAMRVEVPWSGELFALAIFPMLSFINFSCDPNCEFTAFIEDATTDDDKKTTRLYGTLTALKPIHAGDEITIAPTGLLASFPPGTCLHSLQGSAFNCMCYDVCETDACRKAWETAGDEKTLSSASPANASRLLPVHEVLLQPVASSGGGDDESSVFYGKILDALLSVDECNSRNEKVGSWKAMLDCIDIPLAELSVLEPAAQELRRVLSQNMFRRYCQPIAYHCLSFCNGLPDGVAHERLNETVIALRARTIDVFMKNVACVQSMSSKRSRFVIWLAVLHAVRESQGQERKFLLHITSWVDPTKPLTDDNDARRCMAKYVVSIYATWRQLMDMFGIIWLGLHRHTNQDGVVVAEAALQWCKYMEQLEHNKKKKGQDADEQISDCDDDGDDSSEQTGSVPSDRMQAMGMSDR